MRKLIILGAGTGGTIMANKFAKTLDKNKWEITIIDQSETHYYQPGFLFLPFEIYQKTDVIKPSRNFIPKNVNTINSPVKLIDADNNKIILNDDSAMAYDFLIIASGARIAPEQTEGLKDSLWQKNIFDFYTFEGAVRLSEFFKHWEGGKMVINIAEMPIKCPVAPLEFAFLADWFFTEKGIRNKVDIHFVTPLPGAFTRPIASKAFGEMLNLKKINLTTDFNIARVDNQEKKIISWDEQEIPFDLLVSIPTNMGDNVIARSNLGDELNFVPTDKSTLRSKRYENIFVIGDATDLPSSKAGSVAHFEADILGENMLDAMEQHQLSAKFDGHANCFIESGFGKGILIDFNYDTEPLPGKFPLPVIGPLSLLQETKLNHFGKLMFKWIYWNILLKGRKIPIIESHMSMAGKKTQMTFEPQTSNPII
jgi:sulfide:quinone oxidoreductase